jgi:serine/threonine-protein kinase
MLAPGSRLGPYEIVAPLGAGGMGEVYRARDPRLGRDVAIKVIPPSATADENRRRRFEQEARAVAALSHPNVLAIFDIGTGSVPFLVTELLEGETLRAVVERGPLPIAQVIDLTRQIVGGLAAAHARGIVHRDLKPDNVYVTDEGRAKILDFGLARQTAPSAGHDYSITRPQTGPGTVMGTMGYMAPEQLRGLEADQRADIFSCGTIMFEMITGQRAFRAETPADTISAVLTQPPASLSFPPGTPPGLVRIVQRCLEKDAADRFQTARDLAFAIESLSDMHLVPVEPGRSEVTSVAVLPFANLSADEENQYFSDGLAEELINALTRISGLRVASPTSSFRFRGRDRDVRQIGRDLGVTAILEGSVRRAGSRLRVTAQLTNTGDGYHLWSDRYDREMADVFEIQDQIVASIVAALAPALLGEARDAVRRGTENLEAYELYLKGRHFWNQRSPAVMGTAIRCFEDAIALDPEYALAYTGLADCYSILRVYGWTPPEHAQPRALEAVTKAITLAPDLPEAAFSKALYVFHFEPHWRAAREFFLAAIAGSPRMAMFEAYFALFLATEYDAGEARRRLDRALELDPHSPVIQFLAAAAACLLLDFPRAERHAARALELQPESMGARWPQTIALLFGGRIDEALVVGERVVARARSTIYVGVLGMVYAYAGRTDDARRIARELDERASNGEYVVPAARLSVQLALKNTDGVREALAACVDGGAAPFSVIATTRILIEPYRSDPTIAKLVDRLYDGARPPTEPPASVRR